MEIWYGMEMVNYVSRVTIKKLLRELFYDFSTKIIARGNRVMYQHIPKTSDRNIVIAENHVLVIVGRKGITKTYKRIRHNYFWSNMMLEIKKYIQECRNCQLKKLVRLKLKNLCFSQLRRVSCSIRYQWISRHSTIKSGYLYILDIRFTY